MLAALQEHACVASEFPKTSEYTVRLRKSKCFTALPQGAAPTRQTMLYKTPKGWSYVSPGWSDVSNTIVAQPWVTGNALTENPEGVSLNGAWSSIPNVSLVSSISIPCRVHNLAEFVDSASLCSATPSGFLFQSDSLPRVARMFAVAHIRSTLG
jgi:hypothetical protein